MTLCCYTELLCSFRVLAVAAYPTAASGAIADVFAPYERGQAMGISTMPVLVGPILGELLVLQTACAVICAACCHIQASNCGSGRRGRLPLAVG